MGQPNPPSPGKKERKDADQRGTTMGQPNPSSQRRRTGKILIREERLWANRTSRHSKEGKKKDRVRSLTPRILP